MKSNVYRWNWKIKLTSKNIKNKTNSNQDNEKQNWYRYKLMGKINFWKGIRETRWGEGG
jgi:hypothetical protein